MATYLEFCASCGATETFSEKDIGQSVTCWSCGRRYVFGPRGLAPDLSEPEPDEPRDAPTDDGDGD